MHRLPRAGRGAARVAAAVVALACFAPPGGCAAAPRATSVRADDPAGAVPSAPIGDWLSEGGYAAANVGAVALPLDGGAAIASYQPRVALNPGSAMKLLTTYAALSMLGRDYRWQTAFHLRGELRDGVLDGDLVVRGGGDPKLVVEDLASIVAQLRAAGLERIGGDLVLDDSIYPPARSDEGEFDGEPSQPYNVGPFGALMNFKSVRIVVRASGGLVELSFDPDLAGVPIDSRIRLVEGPCRYRAADLLVRDAGGTGEPAVRVSGDYSAACGEQSIYSAVLDHRQFVDALFRAAWRAAGGQWSGRTRIERGAARGKPWFVWTSPRTLADVVRDVDKFSNNVMARHLLLQLAVERGVRPASLEAARGVLRDWLHSHRLDDRQLVLDNGAGLSREARASAAQLAAVLRHAAAGPMASVIRESLPIAGIDGTMRSRFVGEPMAGRAWIKTGSLNEVRAIAGYVAAASGRRYAVAMIVNGPRAGASRPLQDRFLRWVHDNG